MAERTVIMEYRDTEYGDYRDFDEPRAWWDDFNPSNRQCHEAQNEYNVYKYEALDTVAGYFGLDTSEWTKDDFDTFVEMVGLV